MYDYFTSTVNLWYPDITIPLGRSDYNKVKSNAFFAGSSNFFIRYETSAALNDYVAGPLYNTSNDYPAIFAAIEFDVSNVVQQNGSNNNLKWKYSVRLNSTGTSTRDTFGSALGKCLDTTTKVVNPTVRQLRSGPFFTNIHGGFATLQSLVNKFILCDPDPSVLSPATGQGNIICRNSKSTVLPKYRQSLNKLNPNYDKHGYNSSLIPVDYFLQQITMDISNPMYLVPATEKAAITLWAQTLPDSQRRKLISPILQLPQTSEFVLFPSPGFTFNIFDTIAATTFPLFMVIGYMFNVSRILSSFIREKEMKFRELTKIMGINDSTILMSWYTAFSLLSLYSLSTLSLLSLFLTNSLTHSLPLSL